MPDLAAAPSAQGTGRPSVQAFWNACLKGTPGQVKAMIDAGADVNARPPKSAGGLTPLMVAAASNRNLDIVEILLKAGANINARDDQGRTVLIVDVWAGQKADITAALLHAGADVRARDHYGRTALMLAAGNDPDPGIVQTLVKAGADINAVNKEGGTALMFAAEGNHDPAMIAALVKAGANVNAATSDGRTALMAAAAHSSYPKVIEALVKAGANVNAKDKEGNTALIWAAKDNFGNPPVSEALIKAGADVTARNKKGRTAAEILKANKERHAYIQVLSAPTTQAASTGVAKTTTYECYVGGHVTRAGFYNLSPDRRLTVKMLIVAAGLEPEDMEKGYVEVRRLPSPYDPGFMKEIKLKALLHDPKADIVLHGGEIIIVH